MLLSKKLENLRVYFSLFSSLAKIDLIEVTFSPPNCNSYLIKCVFSSYTNVFLHIIIIISNPHCFQIL